MNAQEQPAVSLQRRTRTAAAAWALYTGWAGGHKFYLGLPGWGMFFALWTLVPLWVLGQPFGLWTLLPLFWSLMEALGLCLMSDAYFDALYN